MKSPQQTCIRKLAVVVIAVLIADMFVASMTVTPTYGAAKKDVGYIIRVYTADLLLEKKIGPAGQKVAIKVCDIIAVWVPHCKYVIVKNDSPYVAGVRRVYEGEELLPILTVDPGNTLDLHVGDDLPHATGGSTYYNVSLYAAWKKDYDYVIELNQTGPSCDAVPEGVFFEIPAPVGGIAIPVDKFGLLAPYIGLASTLVVATVATAIYVKRIKHEKKKK